MALKKYLIERDAPGAGKLSGQELEDVSNKSSGILKEMGPSIQWLESFVTMDKIYCVFLAENEDLIKKHAKEGDFSYSVISEVTSIIDPSTATEG